MMPGRALLLVLSGLGLAVAVVAPFGGAHGGLASGVNHETDVRVAARLLADGRMEFALQQREAAGEWAERQLPRARFFPAGAAVNRWLASSPLTVDTGAGSAEVRVAAQRLADGRTEFALQRREVGGRWGERMLPRARFFPAGAAVNRWLASSPLMVAAAGSEETPANAAPAATTCADLEGGCTGFGEIPKQAELGDATYYVEFWNSGPKRVCSIDGGFGPLDETHHAAAREATEGWNDAVGGKPLFAYEPDCPFGLPDGFDTTVLQCNIVVVETVLGSAPDDAVPYGLMARPYEHRAVIPILWVSAEAMWGIPLFRPAACAPVAGAHNPSSPWPAWIAQVVISPLASYDYAAVIAHELGHVLYLDHTTNPNSIMHASYDLGVQEPPGRVWPDTPQPTVYGPGITAADYLRIREQLGRTPVTER